MKLAIFLYSLKKEIILPLYLLLWGFTQATKLDLDRLTFKWLGVCDDSDFGTSRIDHLVCLHVSY